MTGYPAENRCVSKQASVVRADTFFEGLIIKSTSKKPLPQTGSSCFPSLVTKKILTVVYAVCGSFVLIDEKISISSVNMDLSEVS